MSLINKRKYRINSEVVYIHDEVYSSCMNSSVGKSKEGLYFPNPPTFNLRRKSSRGRPRSYGSLEEFLDRMNEHSDPIEWEED